MKMRALCSKTEKRVFSQNPDVTFGKWTFLKCPKSICSLPFGRNIFLPFQFDSQFTQNYRNILHLLIFQTPKI